MSAPMKIYFAPMEGITDGILRRVHQEIFGGVDVYCLPFHKLTQSIRVYEQGAAACFGTAVTVSVGPGVS